MQSALLLWLYQAGIRLVQVWYPLLPATTGFPHDPDNPSSTELLLVVALNYIIIRNSLTSTAPAHHGRLLYLEKFNQIEDHFVSNGVSAFLS